jgi:hypothetical protein
VEALPPKAEEERGKRNMADKIDSIVGDADLAYDYGVTTSFIEAKITKLKGQLEEKLARSPRSEQWELMIDDCEIILKHLDTSSRKINNTHALPRS